MIVTQKEKEISIQKLVRFLKENGINFEEKFSYISIKANIKSVSAFQTMTLTFTINRKEFEVTITEKFIIMRYNGNNLIISKLLIKYNGEYIQIYF